MDAIRQLLLLRNALWSATAPLSRQLLDACTTAVIVIVLVAMGAGTLNLALARAEVAEALSLAQSQMLAATLSYAETGRWPEASTADREDDQRGKYVERIALGEGGRLHMFFVSDAHPLLRDRHATARPITGGGATLRWRLTEDDTVPGDTVDPILIPHAWRLED